MNRKNKKKISWDIKKINEYEIMKGNRMKINEPKTPKKKIIVSNELIPKNN